MATSKRPSIPFTVLRAAIGIGLAAAAIGAILSYAEVDLAAEFSQCKWGLIALGFLFYAALLVMTIVRWYILLVVQDIRLRVKDLVQLAMIGIFWSGVIPGTVTGDFVKMYYVARHAGELVMQLVSTDLRPRQIVTHKSLENAIAAVAATGGSTNAVLHLLAIARDAGVSLELNDFDRVSERTPPLLAA